ncbi:hypothetical protein BJ741DRAFT_599894 [Chytriomyces cf. hyalinus JEL632]|nr:hypothetical protein BJ741DRAFT_599894 [Chytriomyces cf. hyalinus JEL632]
MSIFEAARTATSRWAGAIRRFSAGRSEFTGSEAEFAAVQIELSVAADRCVTCRAGLFVDPTFVTNWRQMTERPQPHLHLQRLLALLGDEDAAAVAVSNEAKRIMPVLHSYSDSQNTSPSSPSSSASSDSPLSPASLLAPTAGFMSSKMRMRWTDVAWLEHVKANLEVDPLFLTTIGVHTLADLGAIHKMTSDLAYRSRISTVFSLLGPNTNVHAHNTLIRSFAIRGCVSDAMSALQVMMDERQIAPNTQTYSHMITAHGCNKNPADAQKWFNLYRKSAEPTDDTVYNSIITALVACDEIPEALTVMSHVMAQDNVSLTSAHMSTFLKALLDKGKYQLVLDWYNRLSSDKSGQLPALNDSIRDVAFDAAVNLRDEDFMANLFPTSPTTRNPSSLVLSEFGLWKLFNQKDVSAARMAFDLVRRNRHSTSPPLPKFLEYIVKFPSISSPSQSNLDGPFSSHTMDAIELVNVKALGTRAQQRLCSMAVSRAVASGDFSSACKILRATLGHGSTRVERQLKNDIVQIYLDHVEVSGGVSASQNLDVLDFETLLDLAWHRDHLERLLDDFLRRGLPMTESICHLVIQKLERWNNAKALADWCKKMRYIGVLTGPEHRAERKRELKIRMTSQRVQALTRQGRTDEALAICKKWPENLKLNAISSLVNTLFSTNRVDAGAEFAEDWLKRSKTTHSPAKWSSQILDVVLGGWLRCENLEKSLETALRILDTCQTYPEPRRLRKLLSIASTLANDTSPASKKVTITDVNSLVERCLSLMDLQPTALRNVPKSESASLLSDFISYFATSGNPSAALRLYSVLERAELAPRPSVHKELLQALAHTGDYTATKRILSDAMKRAVMTPLSPLPQRKAPPTITPIESMDSSWFDPILELMIEKGSFDSATTVWGSIRKKRMFIVPSTFQILLDAHINRNDLRGAVQLMKSMIRVKFVIPVTSLERFLSQFSLSDLKKEDIEVLGQACEAPFLLRKRASQYLPLAQVEKLLILQLEGAEEEFVGKLVDICVNHYKKDGFPSSPEVGHTLIRHFVNNGQVGRAWKVLQAMSPGTNKNAANRRSLESFTTFICAATNHGNIEFAKLGFKLMSKDGFSNEDLDNVRNQCAHAVFTPAKNAATIEATA